jgi:hypothetical protein
LNNISLQDFQFNEFEEEEEEKRSKNSVIGKGLSKIKK